MNFTKLCRIIRNIFKLFPRFSWILSSVLYLCLPEFYMQSFFLKKDFTVQCVCVWIIGFRLNKLLSLFVGHALCCRISYSDFVKTFTHLEVVHLDNDTSRDEPSLHHKNTWQMRLYQGAWQRGVSAGGCRNNPGY